MNLFARLLLGIFLCAAFNGCGKTEKKKLAAQEDKKSKLLLIGLSLADLKEERWQRDRDMFVRKAGELDARVLAVVSQI